MCLHLSYRSKEGFTIDTGEFEQSCRGGGHSCTFSLSGSTEMTCSGDGSNPAINCGSDATCSDGDSVGYTCACDGGFIGNTTTNGPAICTKTCEQAMGEDIFSCGDGVGIKINTSCGDNCNSDTCCNYTCDATLLSDGNVGPVTDAICSAHIDNSILRADSTGVNCSEGDAWIQAGL